MRKPRSKTKTAHIHGVTYTIRQDDASFGRIWIAESAEYPWWLDAATRRGLIRRIWRWTPKKSAAPALAQTR